MKSKNLMIGAAACAALFFFSGVMLCRQYADQKQSAEAFEKIAVLVEAGTPPMSRRTPSPRNRRRLKNMRRSTNKTMILWAGFPLRGQTLIIPLCRPSIPRITI